MNKIRLFNTSPTDEVLMIRPTNFGFNHSTSTSNSFQREMKHLDEEVIINKAISEFDRLYNKLIQSGVKVDLYQDINLPYKPDAIFPNNWFATLPGKKFITFPMESKIRRSERREDIITIFREKGYEIIRDLEDFENHSMFLEGTGSLVLDHLNQKAFAAISSRTHIEVFNQFCSISGYTGINFQAFGPKGELIYHTNVMMSIGSRLAILGKDTIKEDYRDIVTHSLSYKRKVIFISNAQVYNSFLGNCLFLVNREGNENILMSDSAYKSLTDEQKEIIESVQIKIIHSDISTIEMVGGGSVRCMLAEIFK